MAAVAHALNGDETVPVWVDILAVRQWPGNVADLAFEPVVRETGALILVSQHLESVAEIHWKDVSEEARGDADWEERGTRRIEL